MGGPVSAVRWLVLALLLGMVSASAQQIGVYGGGSIEQGGTRQLTAYVPLVDPAIRWTVNDAEGGNANVGTISRLGLYVAPAVIPQPNVVTIKAVSVAEPAKFGATQMAITQPQVQLWSVNPASVPAGSYALRLNGSNFGASSVAYVDGAAVATTVESSTSIRITGTATAAQLGSTLLVKVVNTGLGSTSSASVGLAVTATAPPSPPPVGTGGDIDVGHGKGTANLKAARFLEQASFGPTPLELNKLKSIGIDAWLEQQLAMAETPIPNPGGNGNGPVQQAYLHRLVTAPDQLRQKMMFALGGIFVISTNKNIYPDEMVPYLRILSAHAFGNYRALLGAITTSAQMGKYLDLANSRKPTAEGGANENYAREVMQLFTIGISQLNADGSEKLDARGKPLPTYDQATIRQVALALTGWTYPGPNDNNWENFSGPLVARDVNHDTGAKSFLGCSLPAGQGTVQDTDATLNCLFNHPNTAPFVSLRLIRALVKSNPTPAYVARISAVFADNGAGVRGDLKAVLRAILKDPEARDDRAGLPGATAAQARAGRLKDPLGHVIGFLRVLGGSVSATSGASWALGQMGQAPLAPPSVFGFYSPLFKVPQRNLYGPEFQIYSPTEAVLRNNFLWSLITNPGSDFTLNIAPFVAVAGDVVALIDKVDQALLYGRMPHAMRVSLANALVRQYDNTSRAQLALLLTAVSGQYTVQH